MGKILSSRDEPDEVETLQELVFVAHDVLGKDEDPADEPELVMLQLENAVMDMGERITDLSMQVHMLSMDVIQLSLQHAVMMGDLKTSVKILDALSKPVVEDAAFKKALSIMRREAEPEIMSSTGSNNGFDIDVKLTFSEESLAEALKVAIGEYIDETALQALK